jgi:hypothetical protein
MEIKQEVEAKIATVKALPWKRYLVYTLITVGVLAGLAFAYKLFWSKPAIVNTPLVAKEAPAATRVEKVYIKGPERLVVYNREDLIKKIPIAPEVVADHHNQFTSSAAIIPSPYGGTAVAFTNISTGKSGISYIPKERPWFGFGGQTEVGIRGGIGTSGTTGVAYARQDILRIGKVNLAGYGEAGIHGDKAGAAAMVDVSVRW